jgi:hypothetical protein
MLHIRPQLTEVVPAIVVTEPGKFFCCNTKSSGIKKLSTFFTAIYAEIFDFSSTDCGITPSDILILAVCVNLNTH